MDKMKPNTLLFTFITRKTPINTLNKQNEFIFSQYLATSLLSKSSTDDQNRVPDTESDRFKAREIFMRD
jgi:hypothetical protein